MNGHIIFCICIYIPFSFVCSLFTRLKTGAMEMELVQQSEKEKKGFRVQQKEKGKKEHLGTNGKQEKR